MIGLLRKLFWLVDWLWVFKSSCHTRDPEASIDTYILEHCLGRYTSNNDESLNAVIWSMASKYNAVRRKLLKMHITLQLIYLIMYILVYYILWND